MFNTELQYVLVRYMLNELGDEAANVGLLALTSDPPYVYTRFLDDPTVKSRGDARVQRDSIQRFREHLGSTVETLKAQFAGHEFADKALPQLREMSGNLVRLTLPRSVLTNDVSKEIDLLFSQLVAPKRLAGLATPQPKVRDPLGGLRRDATAAITREIRTALPRRLLTGSFKRHHEIQGKKRLSTFDAALVVRRRSRPVEHLFHHVLLLPDAEESFNQAASLLWKWNDVQAKNGKDRNLTAVLYSREGVKREGLKEAKSVLEKDKVRVVDVKDVTEIVREVDPQLKLTA
jgi:hypothetical protein